MAAGQLRVNKIAYEQDYRAQLERDHRGRTALMHDGKVFAVYDDPNDAYLTGCDRWGIGEFFMKEIGQKPIELGVLSAGLD